MRFSWSTHLLMCLPLEILTSIIRASLPIQVELISGEFCCNFSILNDLTQMVNFHNWIPHCDSHSPALLDLFISSCISICSTVVFPPLGNYDHVIVSVFIEFWSYSQREALFHRIAYDYSHPDWDGLLNHLRDVPWEDIFKLNASPTAREFCESVQVRIDVYIPH